MAYQKVKHDKRNVWHRLMREVSQAEQDNQDCFENPSPKAETAPANVLDQTQLDGFEKVVNEWMDRLPGQELKCKAVAWFGGMLIRLRNKIGTDEKTLNRLEELDRIGMAIASDCVVTLDGHSSVGFERLGPRLSRVCFEGQESVRIVGTEELKPSKCNMKVRVNDGEIACRELVFRDAVTGRHEVRRYALIDDKVGRVYSGRATTNWITKEEIYVLDLIRSILSEVSK